jgi:hypothetical protein
MQSWLDSLSGGLGRAFIGALGLVVRPKLSESEAIAIVRAAAAARTWAIGEPRSIHRTLHLYWA